MTGAQKIGELAVKLADAALVARERGDHVNGLFFACKAAECLHLAKALGWDGVACAASKDAPGETTPGELARGTVSLPRPSESQ